MAVVLTEGFDHLLGSLVTVKGWNVGTGISTGRFSGFAANLVNTTTQKVLPSTYTTLIAGFAFQTPADIGASSAMFSFLSATGAVICSVGLDGAGHLQVRNSAGTGIATGTTALNNGAWNYIELKAVVNGASGSVEVHLNGVTEIAATTVNIGSTAIARIQIQTLVSGVSHQAIYDDIYVVDTTGAAPQNTFLGDSKIETIFPTADGAHTQWTPSSGVTHFGLVAEHSGTYPDGDTTFVSDANVGDRDSYVCGPLVTTTGVVCAVQTNVYARKDDALARQIAAVIRQGGVDNNGGTVTLASTYAFFSEMHNQDPLAAAWTIANVNADEFGIVVIA